jgi:hypothetical protein
MSFFMHFSSSGNPWTDEIQQHLLNNSFIIYINMIRGIQLIMMLIIETTHLPLLDNW